MTKKTKIFFILSTVFTILAFTCAVVFSIWATDTLYFEIQNQPEEQKACAAFALIFVILIILIYWFLSEAVLGVLSIVFSSLSLKYTNGIYALNAAGVDEDESSALKNAKKLKTMRTISIVELAVAIFSTLSPIIYTIIVNYI